MTNMQFLQVCVCLIFKDCELNRLLLLPLSLLFLLLLLLSGLSRAHTIKRFLRIFVGIKN